MIEFDREELFTLREIAKQIPSGRIAGGHIHHSTVYRWASRGLDGVVLDTRLIGVTRFTSLRSLMEFIDKRNVGKAPVVRPPTRDPVREQRTKHLLNKHLSGKNSPERLRWASNETA